MHIVVYNVLLESVWYIFSQCFVYELQSLTNLNYVSKEYLIVMNSLYIMYWKSYADEIRF